MSSDRTTVFIVGAGASTDLGFPAGPGLAVNIAKITRMHLDDIGRITGADLDYLAAARRAIYGPKEVTGQWAAMMPLFAQLSTSIMLAPSIDNYLDLHRANKPLLFLGKMSIAYEIAKHEARSAIAGAVSKGFGEFVGRKEGSWYLEFFRMITERCAFADLPTRFRSVTVITFNYDRSLELFLLLAIAELYKVSQNEAAEALQALLIYHPYGYLGPLMAIGSEAAVPYGGPVNRLDFKSMVESIRTFTEGAQEHATAKSLASEGLATAERIVFLGFGFLSPNMQLLSSMTRSRNESRRPGRKVFGTCYEVSAFNTAQYEAQIVQGLGTESRNVHLINAKCTQLLRDYSQGLKFV